MFLVLVLDLIPLPSKKKPMTLKLLRKRIYLHSASPNVPADRRHQYNTRSGVFVQDSGVFGPSKITTPKNCSVCAAVYVMMTAANTQ